MRKVLLVALIFTGLLQSLGWAAPRDNYQDFLQKLDGIINGTVLPIAETEDINIRSGSNSQILTVANRMLGMPVVWGGASPVEGFDCSGLVQYVFRQAGINLPRTADLQFLLGKTVVKSELRPGDLVYFTTYEPGASHVGIYIGRNKFIHTSFSQGIVAIGDMNDPYFTARYYGAKRL